MSKDDVFCAWMIIEKLRMLDCVTIEMGYGPHNDAVFIKLGEYPDPDDYRKYKSLRIGTGNTLLEAAKAAEAKMKQCGLWKGVVVSSVFNKE